jgi:hypothetical protein
VGGRGWRFFSSLKILLCFGHWLMDEISCLSIYLIHLYVGLWMKIVPWFWVLINGWNFHAYPFISSIYMGGLWMKIVPWSWALINGWNFHAYPFISSIYMGGFWMRIVPCFWALINGWNFHAYPFISSNYVGGFWMKIVPCFGHWLMDEISVPIHLSHPFMWVGGWVGGILDEKPSFLPLGNWWMDEIPHAYLWDESRVKHKICAPRKKKEILDESWMNPSLLACF